MLLIDLTHTAHTRARTGVQRVCRSLYFAAKKQQLLTGCTFDPFAQAWRPLRDWEVVNLSSESPATHRGARWPWLQRWRGRLDRAVGYGKKMAPADGLIVPEIFSATNALRFPELFRDIRGPKIAVFHDAIALKYPELTPSKTVARFPSYLFELRAFDGIAAVSEDSRQALIDYWRWAGLTHLPPVRTIPLAAPLPLQTGSAHTAVNPFASTGSSAKPPVMLCVGSIEGRKNHLSLLDAAESLWRKGLIFELQLIGLAHPETGRGALEKIESLKHAGRPIRYLGAVDEAALEAAYAACDFTVYPSLMEGFGLPVLESIHHGKPCICSNQGALGEAANGGGCLTTNSPNAESLVSAIEGLLTDHELRGRLAMEALARPGRTWDSYAAELLGFLAELRAHGRSG